ncbi:glycogen debranching protein [Rufibacter radiotolerans]|uniref:Glycogen debranching protein n=1 Tax=Rufibacter radiotolerans TaxID=1379910 RepID=A0A0H4VLF1_9BACT|nr:amylo-alpha-1,6-glucosidase [Rufibacter radiotolerans]AKQ46615.1 glycogen debranching protein [Rufibacter radiotolerans]
MRNIYLKISLALSVLCLGACQTQKGSSPVADTTTVTQEQPIFHSEAYSLYPNRVVQGPFEARILSPKEIVSTYKSMAKEFNSPVIKFKFSINGKDNEMVSGRDHLFACLTAACEPPLITFGTQTQAGDVPANTYLKPNTRFKIRLDMRHVLEAFQQKGFYTSFNGDKIYREDFKGVFVAGGTAPLTWDFDNLHNYQQLELKDPDKDGIYELELVFNPDQDGTATASTWKMTRNTASFPQYQSGYPVLDAVYNLALEEMVNAVEPDSTFRTGKEWAGVWTRDISYSIILSMAALQPRVAKYSLMRKVKNGRIVQDTGTGGAYPASSDRMVWAVAAWELYKVTGDQNWLKEAYPIIQNSLEDDLKNVYNPQTGLFKGESSFLDWREQTYPAWMQPADIYQSENLGTNAVFYQANRILSEMATLLQDAPAAAKYQNLAQKVKQGINQYLWMPDKGYYGQFLYGRNYLSLSPKAEALGEALTVLFDIADPERQKQLVANTPVTPFGITCIYPQIPNIPPYHNNGIWPFVQSYWSLAAAKVKNEAALVESMSAIYRPAALWLTNKENFVATNGDYAGTQINSSNMLWSLAGNLSMTYKVIFGMEYKANSLVLKPVVPKAFAGNKKLTNFTYRNAVLHIEMEGHGDQIKTITLDNQPLPNAEIPGNLRGQHTVKIVLANNTLPEGTVNRVPVAFSPVTPSVTFAKGALSWRPVEGAQQYRVLRNGQQVEKTQSTAFKTSDQGYAEYQVIAVDGKGHESFASEPLVVAPASNQKIYEAEALMAKASLPYKGFSGKGFIEVSKTKNTSVIFTVSVPETGVYAIDFRYANGEGPINTENKCAIRSLKQGNSFLGTVVLPQRGTGEWSDWGFTNSVQVKLEKGTQKLTLSFEPANENMNGAINRALVDYLRLTKIE